MQYPIFTKSIIYDAQFIVISLYDEKVTEVIYWKGYTAWTYRYLKNMGMKTFNLSTKQNVNFPRKANMVRGSLWELSWGNPCTNY
jgi:hypothetical protein